MKLRNGHSRPQPLTRRVRSMKALVFPVAALALVLCGEGQTRADTITFSTASAAGWTVTGSGVTNAPADLAEPNVISMTSNGYSTGTPVSGGSNASFTGAWWADFHFTLPANATNVSLTFTGFGVDDRAVATLNPGPTPTPSDSIGSTGAGSPGSGSMDFVPPNSPPSDQAFTFTLPNNGSSPSPITTGFVSGDNDFRLIVNNTNSGIVGTTSAWHNPGDFTGVAISVTVDYTVPSVGAVPEPTSLSLLAVGAFGAMGYAWRRRKCQKA